MENRHGWTVQLAYTWSHEIDVVSNDLKGFSNPFNPAYDRGSGALDRRHIFNANYIYAPSWFTKSSNAFERIALGGWELSGVTFVQSGAPKPLTTTAPTLSVWAAALPTDRTRCWHHIS